MSSTEQSKTTKPSSRRGGFGRVLARVALVLAVVVVVLGGVLAGAGVWFVQRTLPQTTGTVNVAGLEHPVSVLRDQWGVPHITASTLHDVAFAQGYVTAQDRLFQMEVNRRVAQGRLAEMFGAGPDNSLIDADAFLRTLGLYDASRGELSHLDAQTSIELQAYADGVNAFLNTHKDSLPLEFSILGITPQPWTPTDSLAYGHVVALSLDNQWYIKYTRALVLAKAGPDVTNTLFPPYPTSNPTLFTVQGRAAPLENVPRGLDNFGPSNVAPLSASTLAAYAHLPTDLLRGAQVVHNLLGSVSDSLGSNDWVVDGTKTATGKPLLANDPHLGINMPAIWYEVALRGGGLNVIGFSFPGVPGVIIGHNDHIAWGVTNVGADDTDLYLETLDPVNHPGQYEFNGQWLPLQTHQETIRVRGGKPVTITVSATQHGPLLNNVVKDLKGYTPVALKWTALQPGYQFEGFFQLDGATNWQQFLAALSNISISQNFVYADTQGNIGYRASGILPIRSPDNDLLPVDGSTSAHDWQGYVPQDQMPVLFNPPTHVIATANNQLVPNAYPIYITSTWDQGYRARRIVDLLVDKPQLTVADYERIQADVYSIPASVLTPYFIAAGKNARGDATAAASLLQGWDFNMTRDSVAASVYEVTAGTLLRETLEPLLGKKLYNIYRGNYSASGLYSVLINSMTDPASPLFPASASTATTAGSTGATAARDAAITRAMRDAMRQLRSQFGSDTSTWHWGKLHQAHFDHPLASVQPLDRIFGVTPVDRPGDSVTVNVGGDGHFSADPPNYNQSTVSSMREIIDLSNLENSLWVTTTGESGEPFSPHYTDLVSLWDQNHYERMEFSPRAQAAMATGVLILKP